MKIAIAGYGVEGAASYRYWNTDENQVVIVDEKTPASVPVDASIIVGEDAFSRLAGYDMVIRTPGLSPQRIVTDGTVWSATNEFFARCPAPIIGVTGSKGKGTTSSLIAGILIQAGKTVHLVGNIGLPALDRLADITPEDIVVYELSSFQLWDLQRSPQTAVVLMIEPDHLDVHDDFADYLAAKSMIARLQQKDDVVVYNSTNRYSQQIAALSAGKQHPYQSTEMAHVRDDTFYYGEQKICSLSTLQLPGVHNQDNACAAITAAWRYTQDSQAIARGLQGFEGLPHRLRFVATVGAVSYYDDSIATTPGSAIAAMQAFSQPKVIILGGSSKGADFSELATVAARSGVRHAVLIGAEAHKLSQVLDAAGVPHSLAPADSTMSDIVAIAGNYALAGDCVVLSPACASFGQFKNYSDRGDQFIAAVHSLETT